MRPPLTRSTIETAREHAWAVQHGRIIVWHPQMDSYFDTDDTPESRRRFRGAIVAEVGWDGSVTKIKDKKPRRPK